MPAHAFLSSAERRCAHPALAIRERCATCSALKLILLNGLRMFLAASALAERARCYLFCSFCAFSALRADAGCSPRRATYFRVARQESRQRSVPCRQRPCASFHYAPGNLRCSVMGCAAELLSRCALQSNSCRKSVHEVWSLYGDQTQPMPCAPRRWQKGGGQPNFQQPAGIVLFK